MFTLENRKYFDCTLEEKLTCIPLVKELVSVANLARKEGVLALEDYALQSDDIFLKHGIMLVVDGTDPELVKEIMESLMVSSNKCGIELLRQYLTTIGVLSIQAGENPRIIAEKLLSLLGFEVKKKVESGEISINIKALPEGDYYTHIPASKDGDITGTALEALLIDHVNNMEAAKESTESLLGDLLYEQGHQIEDFEENPPIENLLDKEYVMIVDDATFMRMMLTDILSKNGFGIIDASDGIEAVDRYERFMPNVVMLDLYMPNMNGVDVLKRIKAIDSDAKVVVCTAYSQAKTVANLLMFGACDFIVKPFEVNTVITSVRNAIEKEKVFNHDLLQSIYEAEYIYSNVLCQSEIDRIIQIVSSESISESDAQFIENLKGY